MSEVSKYIRQFPEEVQEILVKIRKIILEEVPNAEERISYAMPAFFLNKKPLVYFAGYKNHIGFYATPNGHEEFAEEFSTYKQGKGSVQFALNEEIPYDLILKVVKFRKKSLIKKLINIELIEPC